MEKIALAYFITLNKLYDLFIFQRFEKLLTEYHNNQLFI